MYMMKRYKRYWGVWKGQELICVTVYKKGAKAVVEELMRALGNADS